jgi:GR25 family glycosyltransferase involved in LPS biosynthesis
MLGEYFEQVYLINLPHREDRRIKALAECEKIGLFPQVFPAINGGVEKTPYHNPHDIPGIQWNSGAAALNMTTVRILEDAKKNNYASILILEDDVEFHPQINQIVDENIQDVPDDWEMLLFGCMHRSAPFSVTRRIFRIRRADCLHCYAVRNTMYDLYIEEISKMEWPLDWVTQFRIQPRKRSYCLMPNFAYQRPSYSNIAQMNVSYTFLK